MGQFRKMHGFTLIELMVVVTVAALLVAVGAPSFRDFVLGQRVKSASFDIMASLVMARSEAIKRGINVTLTPSGGNWAGGWVVSAGTETLRTQAEYSGLLTEGPDSIVYDRSGRAIGSGNIEIDDDQALEEVAARCITIGLTGRPTSKPGEC